MNFSDPTPGEPPAASETKGFWEDALTIPNAVSFVRLLGIPYFWYVLLGLERYGLAALLIFLIASTDWIDGWLARRLDQVSELGKALDPLADRLMIGSAIIGGMIAGILPLAIAVALLVREFVVGGAAIYLGLVKREQIAVRTLGKTATFLLYGAIPSFYLVAADIAPWLFGPPAWIAGISGLVLYYRVAWDYLTDIRTRLSPAR
ncbi:MAG: CDP-alcohol phosphatidyltransferase family protein [Acidimicrobiia bacterium]|nr:CDP-alcohol phosphatidyltransferase family protein [Acidimicrobiia bacterium]